MRVLPYGAHAVLLEPDDPAHVLSLAAAASELDGVVEVVPAARTVLVVGDGLGDRLGDVTARLSGVPTIPPEPSGELVTLPVRYGGPDLSDTAEELGLDADSLVRTHAAAEYVVAFCGFVPGFAYLTGLPAQLHVARLPDPRTRVPAGSVGIAGEFTGVYPRDSPGGWRLLGRTDATLWDLHRDPPALLPPGTRVRFRPSA